MGSCHEFCRTGDAGPVHQVDPLEAVGGEVAFVQRGLGLVEVVPVFDPLVNDGMGEGRVDSMDQSPLREHGRMTR